MAQVVESPKKGTTNLSDPPHELKQHTPTHSAFQSATPFSPSPAVKTRKSHRKLASYQAKNQSNATGSSATIRYKSVPRLPHDTSAVPVPPTLMYWSRAPVHGFLPARNTRAHSVTMSEDGATAWLFGGCDETSCANDIYSFDAESMYWSPVPAKGDIPRPCRAHTATLVDSRRIVIFGGGQGGTYYDSVYVFDTLSRNWIKPQIIGSAISGGSPALPAPRRAHTACFVNNRIWIFGGGNGVEALNDLWCLDIGTHPDSRSSCPTPWQWHGPLQTKGPGPSPRGYHTANMVGNVMVVVGGSDGKECFSDVWCLNLETLTWTKANLQKPYRRLSHTATQVGSYLFIIGGHDGIDYRNDILALNLVSLQYEPRQVLGRQPSVRGYHVSVLSDCRILVFGGYNGNQAFDDVWILELAAGAYLPQVTSFAVNSHCGSP